MAIAEVATTEVDIAEVDIAEVDIAEVDMTDVAVDVDATMNGYRKASSAVHAITTDWKPVRR